MTDCRAPVPNAATQPGLLLTTSRLILRRFTHVDLDHLCALNGDPRVVRYLTGGEPISRETNARFLAHYIAGYERSGGGGFGVWAIEERANGAFLGWCALWDEGGGEAELGYRLSPAAWGRGYATEAARAMIELGFTRLDVARIVALIYEENTDSQRVAVKLGMRFVRALRPTPSDAHLTLGIADYPDRFPKSLRQ